MAYPTTFPEDCNPFKSVNLTTQIWYAYTWFYSRAEIRTFTYGLPIVLIIGILGNGSFLFVIARVKRLHTITNYYLASLAAADIAFVASSAISYLYAYHTSPVRHDTPYRTFVGCTLTFGGTLAFYFTSMGLVTLVTLERYYGICSPLQHRAIAGKSRTRALIAGTWLIGFILGFVEGLKFSKLDRYCVIWPYLPAFAEWPQEVEFCVTIHEKINLLGELVDTIPFFVALLWNGYMYARIIHSLSHRPTLKMGGEHATSGQEHLKIHTARIRNQVARVLIINGGLFFLCQIFVRINAIDNILSSTLGIHVYTTPEINGTMLVFGRCMLYVNSSLNPLVYTLTSSYYRDAYKEAFCAGRMCKCGRLSAGPQSTKAIVDNTVDTNI